MIIVVDANRIIAALIKKSTTRGLLFDNSFSFIAPDFILAEVRKYESEIIKKANISQREFELVLTLIFENIIIVPKEEYMQHVEDSFVDDKDKPYLAVCLQCHAHGIWTHDLYFLEQDKVNVFTNIDLFRMRGSTKS